MPTADHLEITCQQLLLDDSTVFSVQQTVLPDRFAAELAPHLLLDHYLRHIRRFTLGIVRPVQVAGGMEMRLWPTRLSLISFTAPRQHTDGPVRTVALAIRGGGLVQPGQSSRGELAISSAPTAGGVLVTLQLSGYTPLILGGGRPSTLRKWLYRLSQAAIHKRVTVRFLARLHLKLTARRACVRVVRCRLRNGEEI